MPVNFDPEALGGPGESVAVGGFESIKIFDQGREIASLHVARGDVTALAWNEPFASLLCGNEDMGVARQDDVLDTAFSPIDEGGILVARTTGMERATTGKSDAW